MNGRTFAYLGIGVIVVVVVVLWIGSSGLPAQTLVRAQAELDSFAEAQTQFGKAKQEVLDALAAEPALFKASGFEQTWPDRLSKAQVDLEAVAENLDKLRQLCEENEKEKKSLVEETFLKLQNVRLAVMAEAAEMRTEANRWLDLKRDLPQNLARMKDDYETVIAVDLTQVSGSLQTAIADWPAKRDDLQERLAALEGMKTEAEELWQSTEASRKAAADGRDAAVDFAALATATDRLKRLSRSADPSIEKLNSLMGQLYYSWDKLLTDMEIREGAEVTFHHKYNTVATYLSEDESAEAEVKSNETWEQVAQSKYKAMEKNLGMVVEHKDAGKYNHEAESLVQPAGYAYMCPPSQERNRYGHWQHRSGGSFWVWYGQYSLMRHMFWGRSYYRPIGARDYGSFHSARNVGRTYYGADTAGKPRYGSGGTETRTRYANSKYVRSGGFKNSRYVKSGGKYRGSRYETRRTTSGRRSGGYSRSGSRRSGK